VPYPLVLLGERIFDENVDHVTMRNVEAAKAATEHLLGAGRRRIAIVGAHSGETIGSAGLRLRGHLEALEKAGVPADPDLIAYTDVWHRINGATGIRALIGRGVPFDAVFALNDALAFGAMRALDEAGLRVPEDVAVIGFDDVDEADYSIPSLTSVDPGRAWIARTAVQRLLQRIAAPGTVEEPRLLLADYRIVVRESA
jgi:DNA-binding LacI/PurR family transcriptional regulator